MDDSFSRFQEASDPSAEDRRQFPGREARSTTLPSPEPPRSKWVFRTVRFVSALVVFLLAIQIMSASFGLLGVGFADTLFNELSANPFIGLFIGLLATAIIQSSSTTITTIVLLVAAGELSLTSAIPIIMGANIGTSVTSTIVSLGHITRLREYIRAISAASAHSFFNIITVIILSALEYFTGLLSSISAEVGTFITPIEVPLVGGILFFIKDAATGLIELSGSNPYLTLPIGLLALFFSLQYLSRMLKTLVIGNTVDKLNRYVFGTPIRSLLSGLITTAAVQSSSMTISLMIPLVATARVSLARAFSFMIGANIGTTITAVVAALIMIDSKLASVAMSVACAHVLINLLGALIIFPFPRLRRLPLYLAEGLGKIAGKNRLYGVAYVFVLFFLVPFLLVFLNKVLG